MHLWTFVISPPRSNSHPIYPIHIGPFPVWSLIPASRSGSFWVTSRFNCTSEVLLPSIYDRLLHFNTSLVPLFSLSPSPTLSHCCNDLTWTFNHWLLNSSKFVSNRTFVHFIGFTSNKLLLFITLHASMLIELKKVIQRCGKISLTFMVILVEKPSHIFVLKFNIISIKRTPELF